MIFMDIGQCREDRSWERVHSKWPVGLNPGLCNGPNYVGQYYNVNHLEATIVVISSCINKN